MPQSISSAWHTSQSPRQFIRPNKFPIIAECGQGADDAAARSPLLLVTDRAQARRPLAEVVAAALTGGCRWVSLREKNLPEDEQMVLARALLPMARK